MSMRRTLLAVVAGLVLQGPVVSAGAADAPDVRGEAARARAIERHLQTVSSPWRDGRHHYDRHDRHDRHRDRHRHWHRDRRHGPPPWAWDPWGPPRLHGHYRYRGYGYPYGAVDPWYYRPRPVYPLYPAPYGPGWSFGFGYRGGW